MREVGRGPQVEKWEMTARSEPWVRHYTEWRAGQLEALLEAEHVPLATPVQAASPTAPDGRKLGPPAALRDQVKAEVRAKCVGAEGVLTAKAMIIVATTLSLASVPRRCPNPKRLKGG